MEQINPINLIQQKIQLYVVAHFLFDQGYSHPQAIEILSPYESDKHLLNYVVDKAMKDEWDKLSAEAKEMYAKGMSKDEVFRYLYTREPDEGIVRAICDDWYNLKYTYLELLHEGEDNIRGGLKSMIIAAIGVCLFFAIDVSWFVRVIWIAALIGAFIQLLTGYFQKGVSGKIERIFNAGH